MNCKTTFCIVAISYVTRKTLFIQKAFFSFALAVLYSSYQYRGRLMTVYIEYAFLENFLFDGALLALALYAANVPFSWGRILFSAFCGAAFALLFPLLRLPNFLLYILKIAVGFLLSLLACGRIKTKKEWGRYAFAAICFLVITFFVGGALSAALAQRFPKIPAFFSVLGFSVLVITTLFLIKGFRRKREINAFLYDCRIEYGSKSFWVRGFLDSGNTATKNSIPVCFLSPEYVYELFGEEILKGGGQVCDEICITTLGGEKNLPLYKGALTVKGKEKTQVYFAPAVNMISREYELLLNGFTLGG